MLKILSISIIIALAATLPSRANEATCNAEPGCAASCPAGCCCPQCGCHEGMCPVCHPYCEMKKITKYKYCCTCEDKCIPHGNCETLFCHHCDGEQPCGCTSGCDSGNCGRGCEGCRECKVYTVKKLVKIPYTVEVPVHKCWVEWVCPKCGCSCNGGCGCDHEMAPAASPSAAPMPPAPPSPPTAGKTTATDLAPAAMAYGR
jgi:hypothetical protein